MKEALILFTDYIAGNFPFCKEKLFYFEDVLGRVPYVPPPLFYQ